MSALPKEFFRQTYKPNPETSAKLDTYFADMAIVKRLQVRKDEERKRDNYYFEILSAEIRKRSVPANLSFYEAKQQWEVLHLCKTLKGESHCICTHDIIFNNPIRNVKTGEVVVVGSCCVEKFGIKNFDLRCVTCNEVLPKTNKYVKSLLDNGVKITKKTKIVGHKKCGEWINYKISQLLELSGNKRGFDYRSKTIVDYFGGMITSIWDKPEGIEISYRGEYEDYLNLVTGLDLQ